MSNYLILAYYKFIQIDAPKAEVKRHKEFFKDRDVTGRIYISHEGINGQMSGAEADARAYMEWLRSDSRFSDLDFKEEVHDENIFPRMTVKVREQLAALDAPVDLAMGGEHVSPKRWKEMMESGEYLLLDVRNDYEWDLGHFKGAVKAPYKTFREFPSWVQELKESEGTDKPVTLCCTGGIRCELFSALMRQEGFEKVFQLKGGIIKYGHEEQGKHWQGKLFVFDDRLAADVASDAEVISHCNSCGEPAERYFNCANMDCNELFISCPKCLEKRQGCCQPSCQQGHTRPMDPSGKPFRRQHLLG